MNQQNSPSIPPLAERQIMLEKCLSMTVGQLPATHPMFPFSVHRWDNCWWVMPNDPPKDALGIELDTDADLELFIMQGKANKKSHRPIKP
jgi:hypothetical protein